MGKVAYGKILRPFGAPSPKSRKTRKPDKILRKKSRNTAQKAVYCYLSEGGDPNGLGRKHRNGNKLY